MKINVKTKIRFNGKEYSDPSELPAEARVAYEKALAGNNTSKKKIVVNGREFAAENEAPDDVSRLYADIMSVVQNNGHVTLPAADASEDSVTKPQVRPLPSWLAGVGLITLLIIARRLG